MDNFYGVVTLGRQVSLSLCTVNEHNQLELERMHIPFITLAEGDCLIGCGRQEASLVHSFVFSVHTHTHTVTNSQTELLSCYGTLSWGRGAMTHIALGMERKTQPSQMISLDIVV